MSQRTFLIDLIYNSNCSLIFIFSLIFFNSLIIDGSALQFGGRVERF